MTNYCSVQPNMNTVLNSQFFSSICYIPECIISLLLDHVLSCKCPLPVNCLLGLNGKTDGTSFVQWPMVRDTDTGHLLIIWKCFIIQNNNPISLSDTLPHILHTFFYASKSMAPKEDASSAPKIFVLQLWMTKALVGRRLLKGSKCTKRDIHLTAQAVFTLKEYTTQRHGPAICLRTNWTEWMQ